MKGYHGIIVKYHCCTNHREARISLYSYRFKERKYIPFEKGNIITEAENYLTNKGFTLVAFAEISAREDIILVEEFKSIK